MKQLCKIEMNPYYCLWDNEIYRLNMNNLHNGIDCEDDCA